MRSQIALLIFTSAFSAGWADPGQAKEQLRSVRALFVSFLEWFGELSMFCGRLARAAVAPPVEGRELIRQMDEIGSRSLPLVALAGAAIGVVLALQTRDSLTRFGGKTLLPAVIVFSLFKET